MGVNNWLRSWCLQQRSGFYEHGTLFLDQRLPGRAELLLTKWVSWFSLGLPILIYSISVVRQD